MANKVVAMRSWNYDACDGSIIPWSDLTWAGYESLPPEYNVDSNGEDHTPGVGYDFRYIEPYWHTNGDLWIITFYVKWSRWRVPPPRDVGLLDNSDYVAWNMRPDGHREESHARFDGPGTGVEDTAEYECIKNQAAGQLATDTSASGNIACGERTYQTTLLSPTSATGGGAVGLYAEHRWGRDLSGNDFRRTRAHAGLQALILHRTAIHGNQETGWPDSWLPWNEAWEEETGEPTLDSNRRYTTQWGAGDPTNIELVLSIGLRKRWLNSTFVPHKIRFHKAAPSDFSNASMTGSTSGTLLWDWPEPGRGIELASIDAVDSGDDSMTYITVRFYGDDIALYKSGTQWYFGLLVMLSDTQQNPSLVPYLGNDVIASGQQQTAPHYLEWWVQFPDWRFGYIVCPSEVLATHYKVVDEQGNVTSEPLLLTDSAGQPYHAVAYTMNEAGELEPINLQDISDSPWL